MTELLNSIVINGVTYTPATQPYNRAVVVVDKGWIFAGDIQRENGRIYLTRVVWVFRWEKVGFAKVVDDPVGSEADIRPIADLDIPEGSEIFSIPVPENWGFAGAAYK